MCGRVCACVLSMLDFGLLEMISNIFIFVKYNPTRVQLYRSLPFWADNAEVLYLSQQRHTVLRWRCLDKMVLEKGQEKGGRWGLSWGKKTGIFAERYRTEAVWLESVSSSSVHQLQYTHSDDAWKSIYATSRERRQHGEGEGEKKIQKEQSEG